MEKSLKMPFQTMNKWVESFTDTQNIGPRDMFTTWMASIDLHLGHALAAVTEPKQSGTTPQRVGAEYGNRSGNQKKTQERRSQDATYEWAGGTWITAKG